MAIATACVLEDMAVALIKTFARRYDQSIMMGDPACSGKPFGRTKRVASGQSY
jgi:hypothetical protein